MINDIHEFVAAVELEDVTVYEERARRIQWTEEELVHNEFPRLVNSFGLNSRPGAFEFRFRTVLTDQAGEFVADIAALYVSDEETEPDIEVTKEFGQRVAYMAVYPYIRGSIQMSATRLSLPAPILPMIRQGELELGDEMSDADVQSQFHDNRSELLGEAAAD